MTENDDQCSKRLTLLLVEELLDALNQDELWIVEDKIDRLLNERLRNGG